MTHHLLRKLGHNLILYSTPLMGGDAFVVKQPPRVRGLRAGSVERLQPTTNSLPLDSQSTPPASDFSRRTKQDVPRLVFAEGTETPSHFNVRVDFLTSTARNALAPRSANVEVQQHSPCSMKLLVGEGEKLEETIVFPYPINGQGARVRVARTTGYVEVSYARTSPGCTSRTDAHRCRSSSVWPARVLPRRKEVTA